MADWARQSNGDSPHAVVERIYILIYLHINTHACITLDPLSARELLFVSARHFPTISCVDCLLSSIDQIIAIIDHCCLLSLPSTGLTTQATPCSGSMRPQMYYMCDPWDMGISVYILIVGMVRTLTHTHARAQTDMHTIYQSEFLYLFSPASLSLSLCLSVCLPAHSGCYAAQPSPRFD